MDTAARCLAEVEDLHRCFEDWFRGKPGADLSHCEAVLVDDFQIVSPGGVRRARPELMAALVTALGAHASGEFAIEVRDVTLRPASPDVHVVSYEEWHRVDGVAMGRMSTAVLRDAAGLPNGLEWLGVHETWCESCQQSAP